MHQAARLLAWALLPFTAAAHARIVDHHRRAVAGTQQRNLAAHATSRTGNGDNLAFKHTRHPGESSLVPSCLRA